MSALQIGYPGLSRVLAHADGLGMFKRFADLNMRNLLYMQAELMSLEDELEVMTLNDHNEPVGTTRSFYVRSAHRLRASSQCTDPKDRQQWDKILEIRVRLKEYSMLHTRLQAPR